MVKQDWRNFKYGNTICKGYGGYYKQKYNGRWLNVYCTPNLNNITASHLVCMPNHPRMWRRKFLMDIDSFSEFLPICDDYEVLLRTICQARKITKIHKLGYIQFMNNNNNNFSLIRNKEINRIGPCWIQPLFYKQYDVHNVLKQHDAYEDKRFIYHISNIWKRKDYNHKKRNDIVNLDFKKQFCLIGLDALNHCELNTHYKNAENDFILLDNKHDCNTIIEELEKRNYSRIKCYSLKSETDEELENYFHLICKHNENYEIIRNKNNGDNEISEIYNLDIIKLNKDFTTNKPFNHIIIDNAIDNTFLTQVKNEILNVPLEKFNLAGVYGTNNVSINKYFLTKLENKIKYLRDYFNTDKCLRWLEQITNLKNLRSDPTNHGGGIHLIKKGGYLNIHEDFNVHQETRQYRVLNILVFLNDEYKSHNNGKLELWNSDLTKCEKIISPLFNRIVIFRTDTSSNHGHPIPWNSEKDRLSLALYYYTDTPAIENLKISTSATWKIPKIFQNIYSQRHMIVNECLIKEQKESYLEIGVETGYTYLKVQAKRKIGVDPDPKTKDNTIILKTSDDFFKENNEMFDVIFIDGMHQIEYVLRDFNNSCKCLNKNGIILIDDVLPGTEEEQYKIPKNPKYENNILKYTSPWTGDVWKFVFYLLLHHKDSITYELYTHENYRGVLKMKFIDSVYISEENLSIMESYDFKKNFKYYSRILTQFSIKEI